MGPLPHFALVCIYVHATFGAVALLAGALAVATRKGGLWHRRAGQAFSVAMVSAIVIAQPAIAARDNLFLGLLSPFTLYLVLRGWRLGRRASGKPGRAWIDVALALGATASGAGLLLVGVLRWGRSGFAPVLVGLGLLALRLALPDLRRLRAGSALGPVPPAQRIRMHLISMLGAYTAALTAFAAVNFPQDRYPPALVWLVPPSLGTVVIVWWSRRMRAGRVRLEA